MPSLESLKPASAEQILEFRRTAPKEVVNRVVRQRLIAEMLESAARGAEVKGRTREANEMREQAAEARAIADRVIRNSRLTP
jgi:hypothetical protein